MSLATDGDYDDLDDAPTIRRPISVAQLLEREGYRPAVRSRATRRALTGVAAGAVLALGAVVGSLLLNHATGNTAGDTLASGSSGADIVLSNHQPAAQQQSQIGSPAIANTTQPQVVQNGGVPGHPVAAQPVRTVVVPPAVAAGPVAPQSTQSAPASPSTPASTPSGSTSTPASSDTSTAPSSPAAPSSGASGSSSSSSGGGGLLGGLTGTLTGTLSSVTQPVFNWFGG